MALDRVKILVLLLCATVLVGTNAYAQTPLEENSSVRIGVFNSQRDAQKFFEAFPRRFAKSIDHDQLWLNAYQSSSGFTEHHLEISRLGADKADSLCAYVRTQNIQCITLTKTRLSLSEDFTTAEDEEKALPDTRVSQGPPQLPVTGNTKLPRMLMPLGLQANINEAPLLTYQDAEIKNRTFSLAAQDQDTTEAKAAKAVYAATRSRLVAAIQDIGHGINTGDGADATRKNLISLGRTAFEAAGNAYLAEMLERGSLPADANAGQAFIYHVQKNIEQSAVDTVEALVTDVLSADAGEDGIINDKVDAFMLSGAKGVIDAGLEAARRSDLYALRHLELEHNLNDFKHAYFSAIVTQPVYQSGDMRHNFFLQGGGILNERSVDSDDDTSRHTLNIGGAYRYLTVDEKYLLGANMFFDYQWPYEHSRMSFGIDAKSGLFSMAANYYRPITGFKDSYTNKDGVVYEERPLEGYDLELGYKLPYLAGMTVFGKGYQYFSTVAGEDDITGFELSAEYKIHDNFALKGAVIEENGGRDGAELSLQYRVPLYDKDKPNLLLAAMEPAAGNTSMRPHIFEKVRRENRIRTEERVKAVSVTSVITAQFNAASIGLPFDVGGILTGAGTDLPYNTVVTIPNGDFGIITFSNSAIANISASGGGAVTVQFDETTLTVIATNGGFVQFISGVSGGITTINVPGGSVNLLGTDIDVTDNGVTTTVQVRAGQVEVVPNVGVDVETGNQADIVSLTIATGVTTLLVDPALTTRREAAFTNLDSINPDPPGTAKSAPFINAAPQLITGPQFVGNNADIRLTFTQPVTVTGAPQLTGFVDANMRNFLYNAAASTPSQLVFRHVFVAGDVGAAGITVQGLDLNGGTIKGSANGLDAVTAFTDTVIAITDQTAPMIDLAELKWSILTLFIEDDIMHNIY